MILFLLFVVFTWLAGVTGLLIWFNRSAGPDDEVDYVLVTCWPIILLASVFIAVCAAPYYLVKFIDLKIKERRANCTSGELPSSSSS